MDCRLWMCAPAGVLLRMVSLRWVSLSAPPPVSKPHLRVGAHLVSYNV